MSKYNLSLNFGEKKTIFLDDLSFSNCVKITNDYEEIIKLLRIGVNLPILPEFKKYMDDFKYNAYKLGYVPTLLGRKRRLPKLTYPKCEIITDINDLLDTAPHLRN